jgi:hypothetical protein
VFSTLGSLGVKGISWCQPSVAGDLYVVVLTVNTGSIESFSSPTRDVGDAVVFLSATVLFVLLFVKV